LLLLVASSVTLAALNSGWKASLASQGERTMTPTVRTPYTERHLGHVDQGTQLRASFPVKNEGSSRLILRPAADACCGEEFPNSVIIGPGQSTTLELALNTGGEIGPLDYTVHYDTNDPRRPQLTLTIRAVVEDSQRSVLRQ
jgi:hypothetical protein